MTHTPGTGHRLVGLAAVGVLAAAALTAAAGAATADTGAAAEPPIVFGAEIDGTAGLYTITPGGKIQQLTTSGQSAAEPDWEPDRSAVLFSSDRGGASGLFSADAVTGDETEVTADLAEQHDPAFAPSGGEIAYTDTSPRRPPETNGIYTASADGTGASQLTEGGRQPAFDTEGTWIAFAGTGGADDTLYRVPAAGGDPELLVEADGAEVAHPEWRPDGVGLLYTEHAGDESRIMVAGRDGGDPRPVATVPGGAGAASFSPGGDKVAFAGDAGDGNGVYTVEIGDGNDPGTPDKVADLPATGPVDVDWT